MKWFDIHKNSIVLVVFALLSFADISVSTTVSFHRLGDLSGGDFQALSMVFAYPLPAFSADHVVIAY